MRNVWKGLVIGGLTGVAAGVVLDLMSGGSDQLARAAHTAAQTAKEKAPDAVDRVKSLADAGAERLSQSDLPQRAQDLATKVQRTAAATAKDAAAKASEAANSTADAARS